MQLKNNRTCLLLLLAFFAIVFSCQKEKSIDTGKPFPGAEITVNTSVQGRILDEKQEPVQGAIVKLGAYSTVTDINGGFLLENIAANARVTTIHVEKAGYFSGSRTIITQDEQLHYVQVELLPKNIAGSFPASAGGTVNAAGCDLVFAANAIHKADGSVYNGKVEVAYAFLNPESERFMQVMPGDLRGINKQEQEVGLESYGMVAVELLGASGEKLALDSSKPATLKLTIPASLRATGPASIPLWYFNEEKGLWQEEGSAVRIGNTYVGTVRHFSFWNCDAPFKVIDFKATIHDAAGNALAYGLVELQSKTGNMRASAYLDATGTVMGLIPANQPMEMKVFTPNCRTEVYKADIGPYSQAADLGIIKVSLPAGSVLQLSGAVTNCSGQPVAAGFAGLTIDGLKYRTAIENGSYSFVINRCNSSNTNITVSAYDSSSNKYGTASLAVGTGAAVLNVVACDNVVSQEFRFILNGQQVNYTQPQDSISSGTAQGGSYLELSAMRKQSPWEELRLSFRNNTSADTIPSTFISYNDRNGKRYQAYQMLRITKRDNVTIEGSMTGNFIDSLPAGGSTLVPFSLTFKALNR
ncbi:carboxypeptidase-like regulatory domain-containing protein [Filimonas effusa]|uniref:Carboxypeptidase regulatory-like domain-containing protein n=1 Tax=Filimonas effusa TaxID=2508721 RepID=A0A4Q1CZV0_9BACT|nr:carboxypeptidase-like regulatory domain-containing protein [Filimonas effusa]RXK80940.1 carboxypeptidase regulatory-like domain-containing protein [Filimonas effusa]